MNKAYILREKVASLSQEALVHLVNEVIGVDTVEERLLRVLEHQGQDLKCWDCLHLEQSLDIHGKGKDKP